MFDIVKHIKDKATKMELEEQRKGCMCEKNKQKDVKHCDDFHCIFAFTEICVAESCIKCMIHNCRGCIHLKDCCDE